MIRCQLLLIFDSVGMMTLYSLLLATLTFAKDQSWEHPIRSLVIGSAVVKGLCCISLECVKVAIFGLAFFSL